jgi:hypothetical protein
VLLLSFLAKLALSTQLTFGSSEFQELDSPNNNQTQASISPTWRIKQQSTMIQTLTSNRIDNP